MYIRISAWLETVLDLWLSLTERKSQRTNEGEFARIDVLFPLRTIWSRPGKGNNCSLTRFQVPIPRIFLALSFFLRVRVWRIANWGKGWLTTVQTLVCLCWPRLVEGQLEYSFWQTFFQRLSPFLIDSRRGEKREFVNIYIYKLDYKYICFEPHTNLLYLLKTNKHDQFSDRVFAHASILRL